MCMRGIVRITILSITAEHNGLEQRVSSSVIIRLWHGRRESTKRGFIYFLFIFKDSSCSGGALQWWTEGSAALMISLSSCWGESYERESKRRSFNMLVELAVFTEEQLLGLQRDRLTHLKWSYSVSTSPTGSDG